MLIQESVDRLRQEEEGSKAREFEKVAYGEGSDLPKDEDYKVALHSHVVLSHGEAGKH